MAIQSEKKTPTVSADVSGTSLVLTFASGETLTVDHTKLSGAIVDAAILHGLKQKLVDAAAISRNPDTGASATAQDKFDAVKEVYDRITSPDGTWNKIRGDGTGTGQGTGLLVRALMALFGKNEEDTRALLEACSDDEVKALRGSPKVAAKIAEFKAATSKVDTNALLAKFGA